MAATFKVPPEVQEILKKSVVTATEVKLPQGTFKELGTDIATEVLVFRK